MSEPEMLYSARQVTESLECSPQMAGRYFQALEKITNTKIKKHGRDGRQFDEPTRAVLLAARDIVRSHSGVTVEDAVRRALNLSQMPLENEVFGSGTEIDLQRFKTVLSEAITAPLRDELRDNRKQLEDIKAELAALRADNQALRQGRELPNPVKDATHHGLLVRVALWVERHFR
jgi:hypothetical protein